MLFLMIIISGIFTGDYEMTGPEKYAIYTILLIDIIALPIGWIILSRQQSNRRKKVLIYSIRNRYDRILDNCGFNPNLGGRK